MTEQVASRRESQALDRLAPRAGARWALLGQLWRNPLGLVSLLLIVVVILMALFAPLIAPYDPLESHAIDRLQTPSSQYLLGTDQLGRDVFSRIIYGARISLLVGLISVGIATVCGGLIGLASGYFGGVADIVTQRVVDAFQAFPGLILALALMSVFGSGIVQVTVAIAIVIAPSQSRVIRGATLSVKENAYIEAARALGATDRRLILRHILPNVTAPILILASTTLGLAILIEGALSFLGLGTPPPTPSWGGMLTGSARAYMERVPTLSLFPGIAISLTVLAFNLFGDTLRDIWDPRLRGLR
jgi:ABC-type dipeptide/oligopeptide/nickel transport system permease subunit